ncbi:hypothetical protein CFC21_068914 [Triticum aestivum]|uniref:Uncharacterized protein n=2 Tax=Triticum aestivum TaxID=4565 RepID=A0A9R1HB92_WHEAT|nr:uncharacterized protein LOC123105901 [Triticum aestivum]XP_044384014.1 uncharacterized protein LOC123105901 [Triticum aestivum]KAF7062293.1 hypothetical protein CFC21_068914 [Triticum aestivum]
MELVYLERRNGLRGDSAAPEFSGRSEDDHHQHLPVVAPEVQSDLALVNYRQTFPLDERKSRSCQSCHRSPCCCGGDAPRLDLCPTLPAKMMILEFLIRSLRHPTRTHNVTDLDDLISGGAGTGDVTLGPSDKMMLDSLHALVNAKTRPPKSPSFFLPGAKMRKTRSRSHTITQSEILKLISPETWEMSSPGASSPSKRSAAELAAHEGTAPSCSGTACLRSSQPGLSSYPPPSSSLSAGLLQCIWKDGLPHFELSLDNPMAMYTASPVKKPHGDGKASATDYVYLFHSDEQGKKDWMGNYSSGVSKLVGKMKVSSSLVLGSDGSGCVETEFVMYGSPDDYLRQMQSAYSAAKGKGLVKRVAEIMRSPNASSSPKHAAWGRFGRPSSPLRFDDDVREMLDAEPGGAGKATGLVSLAADDLPANQEVAAIVVRERREEPAVVGGWGLKFLEKAEGAAQSESRNKKARWCISAIVPRGYHGGVASGTGGPSGLVERWRNGGRCECGGWDLGCPIRVLSNDGGVSSSPEDGAKSVELSPTGARSGGEPAVRLVSVTEGLYILYFDAGVVSPLQCFAAGVAVVHSQAPQLHPKL